MVVVSFMFQWKGIWHLLSWRLGGFQNWSGHLGEEKNLLSLPGIETWILGCPLHSLVTIPAALSGFLWKLSYGKIGWAQCAITLTIVQPVDRHTKKHVTHCSHLLTEIELCCLVGALKPAWCRCVCFSLLMTELQNWSICVLVLVTGATTEQNVFVPWNDSSSVSVELNTIYLMVTVEIINIC